MQHILAVSELEVGLVGVTRSVSGATDRVASLDVFRGTTMILMLYVDVCGDLIPFFGHATWNGLHIADFVMPAFLFAVGASTYLTMNRGFGVKPKRTVLLDASHRALRMFILGVFVQGKWIPSGDGSKDWIGFDLYSFRIMGILQRIGICYLLLSLVVLYLPTRNLRCFAIAMAVNIQVAIYLFIRVPGCPNNADFSVSCNSQSWIDRLVLGTNHLYRDGYDPEGLVSTLGCLLPCFVGFMSIEYRGINLRIRASVSLVLVFCGLGLICVSRVPFNKALWTLPYNLVTTGTVSLVFSFLDSFDIKTPKSNVLVHLGSNAIFFFVFSDCCGVGSAVLNSVYSTREGRRVGMVNWFLSDILGVESHPGNIVVFATIQVWFYLVLTGYMYRRGIFYRV